MTDAEGSRTWSFTSKNYIGTVVFETKFQILNTTFAMKDQKWNKSKNVDFSYTSTYVDVDGSRFKERDII